MGSSSSIAFWKLSDWELDVVTVLSCEISELSVLDLTVSTDPAPERLQSLFLGAIGSIFSCICCGRTNGFLASSGSLPGVK
jgi:hypothetical protein